MVGSEAQPPQRVQLAKDELERLSKEELVAKWKEQEAYVDYLESQAGSSAASNQAELVSLRESEEKLKQQQLEATRRENVLVMRLTTKEQEMQECTHQIQELKGGGAGAASRQLRAALLDPAVNLLFERMRHEVDSLRTQLQEAQNELTAWKFTADSNMGKRLMARCRRLHEENTDLGHQVSSGRTAHLLSDLALHRNFSEEMKNSQIEQDQFMLQLDEEVEGMQSTIYLLQQQLREAKQQLSRLQADRRLANGAEQPMLNGHPAGDAPPATATATTTTTGASTKCGKRATSRATRAAPRRTAAPRTRKRAREQGGAAGDGGPDAKALELDEVQVAQTLVNLYVANKERQQDGSSDSAAAEDAQDL